MAEQFFYCRSLLWISCETFLEREVCVYDRESNDLVISEKETHTHTHLHSVESCQIALIRERNLHCCAGDGLNPLRFLEVFKRSVSVYHLIEDATQRPHITWFPHLYIYVCVCVCVCVCVGVP